jgi:hypothetical protein
MTLIVMAIPRRRRTYGGRSRALRLRPVGVPMAAARRQEKRQTYVLIGKSLNE